jgi:hypothetical protein
VVLGGLTTGGLTTTGLTTGGLATAEVTTEQGYDRLHEQYGSHRQRTAHQSTQEEMESVKLSPLQDLHHKVQC